MTNAPFLTLDLLGEFEARMGARDPDFVGRLAPGLDDAEIDRLTAPLDLTLPHEARIWWRWHDGTAIRGDIVGPGLQLFPVAAAVDECRMLRQVAADLAAETPPITFGWEPAWFPLVGLGSACAFCDCSDDLSGPSAIRFFHAEYSAEERAGMPHPRSLGEMVIWWLEAIEQGVWRYDAGLGGWDHRRELLDRERRLSQLV